MKKDNVLEEMIRFISDRQFKKGDRLPSERQLGTILDASRTTIREAVRKLEERGLLTIKRGSGIYLNRNSESIAGQHHLVTPDEDTQIKDQLEALYIIAPVVAEYAAKRADEPEILDLQDCIVRMSRAIVSKELPALADSDMEFYRILGRMSKNHKLSVVMEQLITGNDVFWAQFIDNDAFVNNTIFAGYVEIVNAIKRGLPEAAAEKIRETLVNAGEGLSKIKKNSNKNTNEVNTSTI